MVEPIQVQKFWFFNEHDQFSQNSQIPDSDEQKLQQIEHAFILNPFKFYVRIKYVTKKLTEHPSSLYNLICTKSVYIYKYICPTSTTQDNILLKSGL